MNISIHAAALIRRGASVNRQSYTVQESCLIGNQKKNRIGNIFLSSKPAQGNLAKTLLPFCRIFKQFLYQRGINRTGMYAVTADIIFCITNGNCLGQQCYGPFGKGVGFSSKGMPDKSAN